MKVAILAPVAWRTPPRHYGPWEQVASNIAEGLIKTPVITTIHGFSSPKIIPVYKKYNSTGHYISISNADRSPDLDYLATVYNGLNTKDFEFNDKPGDYLLYFGRIHPDKGTAEAIEIAEKSKRKLVIAGIIQDENYFNKKIKPQLNPQIEY